MNLPIEKKNRQGADSSMQKTIYLYLFWGKFRSDFRSARPFAKLSLILLVIANPGERAISCSLRDWNHETSGFADRSIEPDPSDSFAPIDSFQTGT